MSEDKSVEASEVEVEPSAADVLDAELTPDERMVAEEDAKLAAAGEDRLFGEEPSESIFPATTNEPAMPEELVRRAKDLDFTDEEIGGFEDPESLSHLLTKIDQQLIKKFEDINQPSNNAKPEPQVEPDRRVEPEQQMEVEPESSLQYDEYMDESIAANFKLLDKRLAEVNEMHKDLVEFTQNQLNEVSFTEFEDRIANLGEDYHPVLGSSTDDRSMPESEAYANASRLWDVVNQLKQISPGMSDDDLFRRAVSATFPDYQLEIGTRNSKAELSNRLRDASGRFTSRPSKRGSVKDSPGEDSEAQEWINQWASDKGIKMAAPSTIDDLFNG